MNISQIRFDKITVYPHQEKLEYVPAQEWIPFPDNKNIFEYVDPAKTVTWKDGENDALHTLALYFIDAGEEYCRNPLGRPVEHVANSDYMEPTGLNHPVSMAAEKIIQILEAN